jgi:hypothetical protein
MSLNPSFALFCLDSPTALMFSSSNPIGQKDVESPCSRNKREATNGAVKSLLRAVRDNDLLKAAGNG